MNTKSKNTNYITYVTHVLQLKIFYLYNTNSLILTMEISK